MWTPGVFSTASWKKTLSKVKLVPETRAPFSSLTLPIRPFLKVALSPWLSKAAPPEVLIPPASMSIPSKTTLSNWL